MSSNPYDQLPYRCQPIEWTAPERLALASMLHGGPLPSLKQYRVLELGCGDGANLIPLAYYRPQAEFVGVDGGRHHIETAQKNSSNLHLSNLSFLHKPFEELDKSLEEPFDFIIVHGVFSWVPDDVRDLLFKLCSDMLSVRGLLYLNYNTKPGWNIRGMVRDYLLAHTQHLTHIIDKVRAAKQAAEKMSRSLSQEQHPYSQLMANEFQFICDNHDSYIAHEFLALHNKAYWRSEFMALATQHGLYPVADADHNYDTGRESTSLAQQICEENLLGNTLEDTLDLINYRQLHSPILSKQHALSSQTNTTDFTFLHVASCLHPSGPDQPNWYQHPNGYQVEAKDNAVAHALDQLRTHWPESLPLSEVFSNPNDFMEDILLLHHNGLIELRLPEAPTPSLQINLLNQQELAQNNYYTTANHQRAEADWQKTNMRLG